MSILTPRGGAFVAETSNTVGTGIAFNLLGAVVVGALKYSRVGEIFADGETVYYVRSQQQGAGTRLLFESGLGTYSSSTNKITPTVGRISSAMSPGATTFIPVTWTGGVSNVTCVTPSESNVTLENLILALSIAFSSSSGVSGSPFHTGAFLDAGLTTGLLVQLVSGGLPAIGGVNLTSLPTHSHTNIIVTGLTGGAVNRICRSTGSTTVTEATAINASGHSTDTADQLSWLVAKGSDGVYYKRGVVPFTGVVAGNRYFLGTLGVVTTTRVTVDGVNSLVDLGYSRTNDVLDYDPQRPVTERLSTGAELFLDNGNIAVP